MKCERCQGVGFIRVESRIDVKSMDLAYVHVPCPRCCGNGLQHCCEGDQAQPRMFPRGVDDE